MGAIALAGCQNGSSSNCKLPGSGQPLSLPAAFSACPTGCCRNWPKDAWSKVRYQHSSKSHWVSVHFSVRCLPVLRGSHVQVCITLEEPSPGNTIMHLKHTGIPHEDE